MPTLEQAPTETNHKLPLEALKPFGSDGGFAGDLFSDSGSQYAGDNGNISGNLYSDEGKISGNLDEHLPGVEDVKLLDKASEVPANTPFKGASRLEAAVDLDIDAEAAPTDGTSRIMHGLAKLSLSTEVADVEQFKSVDEVLTPKEKELVANHRIDEIVKLSQSNEGASILKFAAAHKLLTPQEQTEFARRRDILVEEVIIPAVQRLLPPARTDEQIAAQQALAEAAKAQADSDRKATQAQAELASRLLTQLPHSLLLPRFDNFEDAYAEMTLDERFVFDTQWSRDYQAAATQYGAATLDSIGIFERPLKWHTLKPDHMVNPNDKPVTYGSVQALLVSKIHGV